MRIDKVIDAEKVASIAERMQRAEELVRQRETEKQAADRELNSAQCALSNLRLELSRAVDNHLDLEELKQPRPQRFAAGGENGPR